jgi:hypothetical protein
MRKLSSSPPAEPVAEKPSAEEPAWLRNRRLRQAQSEAANEHGQSLIARYGDGASYRPRFAAVKYSWMKRRRR